MTSRLSKSVESPLSSYDSYQMVYNSIEGYAILLGRKVEHHASDAEYTLRGCVYNPSTKGFIGRFCESRPFHLVESLQSGAVICPINQSSYLYSSHEDASLVLIVELTAKYLDGSDLQDVCLGWSMHLLAHKASSAAKSLLGARKGSSNSFRLAMYEGSPRALFSLSKPAADNSCLVPIPGCILTVTLDPHPTLTKALHLLPTSTLITLDDVIPGIIPTTIHEAFPKLMKSTSCTLEKLSLLLLPSVDDFEDQLLLNLAEDLVAQGSCVSENNAITIEERRLKAMVYNGWRYVGSPAIGYLEKVAPSSRTYGLRSNLLLKGSLELSDLFSHPLLEVVLQLEYVISWKSHTTLNVIPQSPRRSSQSARPPAIQTTHLPLGWAVYQPICQEHSVDDESLQQQTSVKQVSLELKSGPAFLPAIIPFSAHTACYKSNLTDVGKVTFRFFPSKVSARLEGSQLLYTPSVSNVVLDDTLTPRRPPSRTTPDIHVEGAPRPILSASTPVRRVHVEETDSPSVQTPLKQLPVEVKSGPDEDRTPQHYSISHNPISRSTLAYFHQSGLEEFKDSKSLPLPQAVIPTTLTFTDALQHGPYQIGVQFLGFKPKEHSHSCTTTQSLTSLLLELHLYHFPERVLKCSVTPPPSHSPGYPHVLGVQHSSKDLATVIHQYNVHLQSLSSRAERSRFAAILQHGHLTVDVYDGESLILLGVARVPLIGIIYSESEDSNRYFQQSLSCPVFMWDSSLVCHDVTSAASLHGGCPASSSAGQLYLRLARLPPVSGDLDHHSKPDISLLAPKKKTSQVARRLYGGLTMYKERTTEDEATRTRKHSRMQRVREARLKKKIGDPFPYNHMVTKMPAQSSVIDVQREELKHERINCVLQEALTSRYLLRPVMGQALYFEHTFTNTFNHPLSINIAWSDQDLKLVMDRQECEYLRQIYAINAVNDLFVATEGREGGQYGFFVHPGEAVSLPLKYQCFQLSGVSSDSDYVMTDDVSRHVHTAKKSIKVYLQASHKEVVGIIELHIEPRPQRIDNVFHFYHPERTFLKKSIDIDTEHPLFLHNTDSQSAGSGVGDRIFVCASDQEVTCELRSMDNAKSVLIKCRVGLSPAIQRFCVFIYRGAYQIFPDEIWQIVIHSAQKVSHSLTLGQSSSVKLTVRGDHTHRTVSCYSYSASIITVIAPSPFLLNAHSLHELHISLKTLSSEPSSVLVSAVEQQNKTLMGLWMLAVTVQEPEITRAFQISLPSQDNKITEKSITFTNPYSKAKDYLFSTDCPGTVQFKETSVKLQPQETTVLYLLFQPVSHVHSTSVLVFINDSSDQIEECFLIKIIYD